jgi:hypothetical protein
MFNFAKYPELAKMHKKYGKHNNITTRALIQVVDKNASNAEKKFKELRAKEDEFLALYERVIFDNFVKIKPMLFNRRTNSFEHWDNVFGDDFDKIPESSVGCLSCAIEEDGGIYRLPAKYYIDKKDWK